MRDIVWASQATLDVAQALDFYNSQNCEAAHLFATSVEDAIELINRDPEVWEQVDRRHRRYIMRRFPYSIIYRFNTQNLTIVAIAHASRRPNYWQE